MNKEKATAIMIEKYKGLIDKYYLLHKDDLDKNLYTKDSIAKTMLFAFRWRVYLLSGFCFLLFFWKYVVQLFNLVCHFIWYFLRMPIEAYELVSEEHSLKKNVRDAKFLLKHYKKSKKMYEEWLELEKEIKKSKEFK